MPSKWYSRIWPIVNATYRDYDLEESCRKYLQISDLLHLSLLVLVRVTTLQRYNTGCRCQGKIHCQQPPVPNSKEGEDNHPFIYQLWYPNCERCGKHDYAIPKKAVGRDCKNVSKVMTAEEENNDTWEGSFSIPFSQRNDLLGGW